MQVIANRISQIRQLMAHHGISAYIIPGTDPFLSEYLPDCWNQRLFISGFSGSAGKVVITETKAGLWTDSRYFLQAEQELKGSGIELYKIGKPTTLPIPTFLKAELQKGAKVGINTLFISVNDYNSLFNELADSDIQLISAKDFVEEIWNNQPPLPLNKVQVLSDAITGESIESKLNCLRTFLDKNNAEACFISSLDEIAWLYNIRGTDIAYNPVCISYAMVTKQEAFLYIHEEKISEELRDVKSICCVPFDKMVEHLNSGLDISTILIDPSKLNYGIYKTLQKQFNTELYPSWVTFEKSKKNNTEALGTKRAMVKDGVALVRFFIWLESELNSGKNPTEFEIGIKLCYFRSLGESFKDESFSTIAGYAENGATVHYSAKKDACKALYAKGILLLDSGGQYEHGTTDITRTVALGEVPSQAKTDYTLVLKGHLALSRAVFPAGTRGDQLDALARQFLWNATLDYGHGTGHGVGHFLNVHEGPQSIRKEYNPVTLEPGMVCSNEPGLYRQNEYGIRIENLVVVKQKVENEFGDFLEFETLTLFPYDISLIQADLLNKTEVHQINAYHLMVQEILSDQLTENEQKWLANKTRPLT